MLDREKLKHYENWIGETPLAVWAMVVAVGGWQNVFPGPLPIWASRVRQFFNVNPMSLTLLDFFEGRKNLKRLPAVAVNLKVKTIFGFSYVENEVAHG